GGPARDAGPDGGQHRSRDSQPARVADGRHRGPHGHRGCGGGARAPVADRGARVRTAQPDHHELPRIRPPSAARLPGGERRGGARGRPPPARAPRGGERPQDRPGVLLAPRLAGGPGAVPAGALESLSERGGSDAPGRRAERRSDGGPGPEAGGVGDGGEAAIKARKSDTFDLVITDLRMREVDGLAVLRAAKEQSPQTVVLVITAFASTETAVEAMKLGAYDYLTKPFKVDEIKLTIANALERKRLQDENQALKRQLRQERGFENFLGKSPQMLDIFETIRKAADSVSTVLITGE